MILFVVPGGDTFSNLLEIFLASVKIFLEFLRIFGTLMRKWKIVSIFFTIFLKFFVLYFSKYLNIYLLFLFATYFESVTRELTIEFRGNQKFKFEVNFLDQKR